MKFHFSSRWWVGLFRGVVGKKVFETFYFLGFHVDFKSYFCTFFLLSRCFVALWKTCNCFSKQFMSFSQQLNFFFLLPASATDNYGRVSKQFFKAIWFFFGKWKYVNYNNHFFPSHLKDLNESRCLCFGVIWVPAR